MVAGSRHVRHTQHTPQRAQLGRRERWCAAEYRINKGWVSCFTRQGGKRGMDEDHEDQAVWRLGPGFQHGDRGRGVGVGWWREEGTADSQAAGQPSACVVVGCREEMTLGGLSCGATCSLFGGVLVFFPWRHVVGWPSACVLGWAWWWWLGVLASDGCRRLV